MAFDVTRGSVQSNRNSGIPPYSISHACADNSVVPSEDEHQSEEVALKDKRREWVTGFKGSAGTAVIPASSSGQAILFVDPRYSIQARKEVVQGLWEVRDVQTGQGSTGWIGWAVRVCHVLIGRSSTARLSPA